MKTRTKKKENPLVSTIIKTIAIIIIVDTLQTRPCFNFTAPRLLLARLLPYYSPEIEIISDWSHQRVHETSIWIWLGRVVNSGPSGT